MIHYKKVRTKSTSRLIYLCNTRHKRLTKFSQQETVPIFTKNDFRDPEGDRPYTLTRLSDVDPLESLTVTDRRS